MKALIVVLLTSLSTAAFAVTHEGKGAAEFTPEQRKQMADMHTKIAACLNSNTKTMQECQQEMQKTHPMMAGKMGCPMMGSSEQQDTKTKTTK